MAASRICSIPNCDKPHKAHGWCVMHYRRQQRANPARFARDPARPKRPRPAWAPREESTAETLIRLAAVQQDECVIWPHSLNKGRGHVSWEGRHQLAARQMCELFNGPPPKGNKSIAAHSCGNGHLGCVNHRHLRWVSNSENGDDTAFHRAEEYLFGFIHPGEVHPRVDRVRVGLAPVRPRAGMDPVISPEEAQLTLEILRRTLGPNTGTKGSG